MTRNMNGTDRIVRTAVGAGLMGYALMRKNWWGAIGAYPLVTGLLGICPVYSMMHMSTKNPVEGIAEAITETIS